MSSSYVHILCFKVSEVKLYFQWKSLKFYLIYRRTKNFCFSCLSMAVHFHQRLNNPLRESVENG